MRSSRHVCSPFRSSRASVESSLKLTPPATAPAPTPGRPTSISTSSSRWASGSLYVTQSYGGTRARAGTGCSICTRPQALHCRNATGKRSSLSVGARRNRFEIGCGPISMRGVSASLRHRKQPFTVPSPTRPWLFRSPRAATLLPSL